MAPPRKALESSPPWHVDVRLTDELPEDNVIRKSFVATTATALLATLLLILGCWLYYLGYSYENDTAYWDRRISTNRDEGDTLKKIRRELIIEAEKIDRAYTLMQSPYVLHRFVQQLGRTRPERLTIHRIESSDVAVIIRGGLDEPSERASRLMGAYVESLRADPIIGPYFREITLTGLDRADTSAHLSFEIVLKNKFVPLEPVRP